MKAENKRRKFVKRTTVLSAMRLCMGEKRLIGKVR